MAFSDSQVTSYFFYRKESSAQLHHLRQTAQRMPDDYFRNAGYLFRFLNRVTEFTEKNRMTPATLGIIFGPTLMSSTPQANCLDDAGLAEHGAPNGHL